MRALVEIVHDLRSQYISEFYTSKKITSHWHKLTMKVANRDDLKIRAWQGYYDNKGL